MVFLFVFEAESHPIAEPNLELNYIAQVGFQHREILLPRALKCQGYRYEPVTHGSASVNGTFIQIPTEYLLCAKKSVDTEGSKLSKK